MTTYYNYLGQAMAVSDTNGAFLTGNSAGHETLQAPTGPSSVTVNGGKYTTIIGADGDNTYYVCDSTDIVQVANGLTGVKTVDSLSGGYTLPDNVNNLTFYGGGSWGVGNALNNLIIMGGNDNNYMDGGAGNDVLVGGFGQNNFGFEANGGGNDVIYNFHVGQDTVRLSGSNLGTFAQIQAAMSQVGSDVVLRVDANDSITFRGVQIADFHASNFLLPLDTSKLGALTFDDEFNSLQLYDSSAQTGLWKTHFGNDPTKEDNYTITSNQEQQVYTDASFQGTADHPLGLNPFSISSDGVLSITAQQLTYAQTQDTWGQPYSSGMLNTQGVFMQKYGYFEMRAALPSALGSWPAFWLSQDPYKPGTEADVLEHLAMYPNIAFTRSDDGGTVISNSYAYPDPTGMHTYGMMWSPTTTTFYIDQIAVLQLATPTSWTKPMYMLVNLAMGGWGGDVDNAALPATMDIDYVRVYGLADTPVAVSVGAATYTAAAGVNSIGLIGADQTITGNNSGDTFISNDTGNHLIGGTGADVFKLGAGGDVATGGAGADTFIYAKVPVAAGEITDFSTTLDTIDLSPLLTSLGYAGATAVADGYVKFTAGSGGQTNVWIASSPGTWSLLTVVDGVAPSGLKMIGDTIVGASVSGSGGGSGSSVTVTAAAYIAPSGVANITLAGISSQTVTGNNAGDTFVSNGNSNHLIGGSGADTFGMGAGGDVATGGGGSNTYVFAHAPILAAEITDFTPGVDTLDLSQLMASLGYAGSTPDTDGYLKIGSESGNPQSGNAQIWISHTPGSPDSWSLLTTLDGVLAADLTVQGDTIVGAPNTAVSVSDATYTAPAGVKVITLTGAAQTVTGNNTGDTFVSNNTGNHLNGGTGNDTFRVGGGGDVLTGGAGADAYDFTTIPATAATITDFAPGADTVNLTSLLTGIGYEGSTPIADGFIKIESDGSGNAQIWADLNRPGQNTWSLVATLTGVSASGLHMNGGVVGTSSGIAPTPGAVSIADVTYTAPSGVRSITLTATAQTITGNDDGDTFNSNNSGNHLIGGAGADLFLAGANDVLTGGAGADTFTASATAGQLRVTDFSHAQGDRVDLTAIGTFHTFSDVMAAAVQTGADTSIDLGNGGTLVLQGVQRANLAAGDFIIPAQSANQAPTVSAIANQTLAAGSTLNVASLIHYADADGDAAVSYRFWDGGTDPNSGYFSDSANAHEASGVNITVAAANLSSVVLHPGSVNGTETMWVQASDGKDWGTWQSFTLTTTAPVNHAPTLSAIANQTVAAGSTLNVGSLIHYADADGDAAVSYRFWDGGSDPTSGYFSDSANSHEASGVNITVAAANLSSVVLHPGSVSGTETMWAQAFDGKEWGAWQSFTLTSTVPVNHAPTLSAIANQTVAAGSTLNVASLIHYADTDGDAAVSYRFWDGGTDPSSGYFSDSANSHEGSGVNITVAAANLNSVVLHPGSVNGTETMWAQAFDGKDWGAWQSFTLTSTVPVNHAPTLSAIANQTVAAGSTLNVGSLIHYADADGDAAVSYRFWDGGSDPTSGYFSDSANSHEASGVNITVAAADLNSVVLHPGSVNGTETMWAQAFDGKDWGAWQSFTLTSTVPVNHAPTVAVSDHSVAQGSSTAISSWLSTTDADGDAITQYRFWDGGSDPTSGYFSDSANSHESSGVNITVNAADLGSVMMHGGSVAGSETMWAQAFDGKAWGPWQSFTLTTLPNTPPQVTIADHSVQTNSSTPITSWMSYFDSNGDAAVTYEFWDSGTDPSSGYFSTAGVSHAPTQANIDVAAADLGSVMVHGGSAAGSETLWARAYDGHDWGAWVSFNLTTHI